MSIELEGGMTNFPEELERRKRIIAEELKDRTLWFVQLRWWVPPSIVAVTVIAKFLRVEFPTVPLFVVAFLMLAYNVVLYVMGKQITDSPVLDINFIQQYTFWQVGLDYASMFLLIHYTGGAASPLIFFFIFHIIFASILLPPRVAYGFSAISAIGMAIIAGAEYLNIIPHHALYFRGRAINLAEQPFHVMVELAFFTASVFITAFSVTSIMKMLRKRIVDLAELTEKVNDLNNKLQSLYAMVQAIGGALRLEQVLKIVTTELATVMNVKATSVKLLSEDHKTLRYASAFGLPQELVEGKKTIELAKSPLNKRIIEGEPYVTGKVSDRDAFQFGEELAKARIQSVLFVPLIFENKVIGILGAYCEKADRFQKADVEFFQLAGGLIAIALENARAYEEIENLVNERSRFMMRVAHNLRAPLAAMLSILEVVKDGYKGELNDEQKEYLRRVDRRARTMIDLVNELLLLSQSRATNRKPIFEAVDIKFIAGRIERTFQDEARDKGIILKISVPAEPLIIQGNPLGIEQMLENLVSNAIKYTPSGGKVEVSMTQSNSGIKIEVSDTGIGIPKEEKHKLFSEFFRASNAKAIEEIGTGLGLAIVKEIVDQHNGKIMVESEEGLGTIFVIYLPLSQEGNKNENRSEL